MTPIDQLREKVLTLQNALLTAHPSMPVLLREIHQNLKADEELVTLLTEEEIGVIVNGLQKQTQTTIIAAITKKGTGKSLKKTTLADL
jgi:pyocin large subunit-like protein